MKYLIIMILLALVCVGYIWWLDYGCENVGIMTWHGKECMEAPTSNFADAQTIQLIEIKGQATPELMNKIYETAEEYGVDPELMVDIIDCETAGTFDPKIQSKVRFKDGTRENSWGLSQIYIDVHDVTKEQVTNPDFAIRFMAKKLSEGKGHLWSCWKKLEK